MPGPAEAMLDAQDDLAASTTWQPVDVLVLLVKRSLNWLPLSVRTFAVVLQAPQWRRHRKSTHLRTTDVKAKFAG